MKKIVFAITLFFSCIYVQAQTDTLPKLDMPSIPYTPKIKKGWVGQFVYEVHFDGESSGMFGKFKQYYKVKADCVHSGFIEFPLEVRGAIRVNQPDKNNSTRWESWIRSGTSFTFSNVDVTVKSDERTGALANDAITGSIEKTTNYSSAGGWAKGWLSNTDLQIDHTTGKYTFAIPDLEYEQRGKEQFITTTVGKEKKDTIIRDINSRRNYKDLYYVQMKADWAIVEGDFKPGQTEIVIRKRLPLLLQQTVTNKGKDVKLSAARGYMDFYVVLRRIG
ncbi:MAG: hypothetical protein JNK27_04845 [Chitinophagaceae bacterium]|nr:hypothetical protein [Chitinophagaceae bacterium]